MYSYYYQDALDEAFCHHQVIRAMTSRFSKGDYTAQIFAYEPDTIGLLQRVQLYVAAGNALYGAVFLCRYSRQPSAIEKRAIAAAAAAAAAASSSSSSPRDASIGTGIDPLGGRANVQRNTPSGELTLTLIHPNTTFRFDNSNNRLASPKLTWPDICTFFTPGAYADVDLILKDQFLVSPSTFVSRSKTDT